MEKQFREINNIMIKSLEKMEEIVKNFQELSWIGWDVVELKKSPTAMTKVNGIFINGNWYIKTVFKVSSNGWTLPAKYLGKDEK